MLVFFSLFVKVVSKKKFNFYNSVPMKHHAQDENVVEQ